MSYILGFGAKVIVREKCRSLLAKVLSTGEWSDTSDIVFQDFYEECIEWENGKSILPVIAKDCTFIGSPDSPDRGTRPSFDEERLCWVQVPGFVFDPESGYWEFEQEYNHYNGSKMCCMSYIENNIIPYISDEILEITTYCEDIPGGFQPNDNIKENVEKRIEARKQIKTKEELRKWIRKF